MKVWKKMKFMLWMMLLCVGMLTMPVYASTTTQDGIEVTLTTDKEAYSQGETIVITLTVTNTNDIAVNHVSLENHIPDGYKIAEGLEQTKQIDSLAAGETVTMIVTYVPENSINDGEQSGTEASENHVTDTNAAPPTGDESIITLWIFLFLIACGAIIISVKWQKKTGKKILSLFLCITFLIPSFSANASTGYEDKSFKVEHTVKVDNTDITIDVEVSYQIPMTEDENEDEDEMTETFLLRANKKSVMAGDNQEPIFLYLETNEVADEISLFYGTADNMNEEVKMYDNGINADDIAGDGIYSAEVSLDISTESEISFIAKYNDLTSNVVKVYCYPEISEETYETIEVINSEIKDLIATYEANSSLSSEEKSEMAMNALNTLAENGQIEEDSISHNEENGLISFMYPDGILGGIMYEEYNTNMNSSMGMDIITDSVENSDEEESSEVKRQELTDSYDIYNVQPSGNIAMFANELDDELTDDSEVENVGNAIILNSFPAFETKSAMIEYRTNFYLELETQWENLGLDTTLIMSETPTIEDYKNLEGYDVICISTHGSRYDWNDGFLWLNHHEYSAICLAEEETKEKNKQYKEELKQKQVAIVNDCYWILPSFFENTYKENAFEDTFVFSECCMSMGTEQGSDTSKYDYTMANSFLNCSAKSYIGFHNSVFADYSRNMMDDYVVSLIEGKTSGTAYMDAVEKYGENHAIWYESETGTTLKSYYEDIEKIPYDPDEHIAYPVFNGNEDAVLNVIDFLNGSFENYYSSTTVPKVWECKGDVRTLTVLGSITPVDESRMAFITTGIGSQDSASFDEGTEGSSLSQTFIVPEDAVKITFSYNFISEEPMEYVGSIFDDSFVVKISQEESEYYNNTFASINTSEWQLVEGIDFIGGDHTTYETGWQTAEIDVSSYQGEKITLDFIIYDVGDRLFDSACVIDNVVIQ